MKFYKRGLFWIIILILIILVICIKFISKPSFIPHSGIDYSCNNNGDCISQCSRGCVNINWAKSNADYSECFRAWDCSCNNGVCYTDGMPRQ